MSRSARAIAVVATAILTVLGAGVVTDRPGTLATGHPVSAANRGSLPVVLSRSGSGHAEVGGGSNSMPATGAVPVRLHIPGLHLDAAVVPVAVTTEGAMAVPDDLAAVGWYSPGVLPGMAGDAVFDGHLGLPGAPLIFRDLGRLRPGDGITVDEAGGITRDFIVTDLTSWPNSAQPPALFDRAGPARITLITCDGAYDVSSGTYERRLLVTAELDGAGAEAADAPPAF